METEPHNLQWTLLHVACWLASSALLAVDALAVRGAVLAVMLRVAAGQAAARVERGQLASGDAGWAIRALDMGTILVLACIGVALSVVFEYYYRTALRRHLLLRRVGKVLAIELGVIALATGLQALLLR